MFTVKQIVEKFVREEYDSIRCDICKVNVLKDKEDDDEAVVATLTLLKTTTIDVKQNGVIGADDVHERESCELCEKCYKRVIEFLKTFGAKIPSSFFSAPKDEDDEISET
jgi:hypothetical protein